MTHNTADEFKKGNRLECLKLAATFARGDSSPDTMVEAAAKFAAFVEGEDARTQEPTPTE